MKLLDRFSLAAASSLARLAFLAPVRSHPTRNYVEHVKTAGCGTAVPLTESAFPIMATPGFCETLLKLRPEQDDWPGSADFASEDLDRFIQRDNAWNYPIVPWED